jgi:hypothetical protein
MTYNRDKIVYLRNKCGSQSDLNVSFSVITFPPDDVIVLLLFFNFIIVVLFLVVARQC